MFWIERLLSVGLSASLVSQAKSIAARSEEVIALTVAAIKTHTRQFAKRQMTWFRSLAECTSIPLTGEPDPVRIAQSIYSKIWRR